MKRHCRHNKYEYTCKECKGAGICVHNKQKRSCKECIMKKKIVLEYIEGKVIVKW